MYNTNNSSSNSSQCEFVYLHIFFSFAQKDYVIAELLTVFSAAFLDLIYLHNVMPPKSPFAANRVRIPNLNLLTDIVIASTNYKIYYCIICPTLGQSLTIAPSNQQPNNNPSAPHLCIT